MNVFLLLCALAKSLQITFSPCGDAINVAQFNPLAVFGLISRTSVLHKDAFIHRTASQSLIGINLSGAYGVRLDCGGLILLVLTYLMRS